MHIYLLPDKQHLFVHSHNIIDTDDDVKHLEHEISWNPRVPVDIQ